MSDYYVLDSCNKCVLLFSSYKTKPQISEALNKMTAFQMSLHSTSEERKSRSASCCFPKCS